MIYIAQTLIGIRLDCNYWNRRNDRTVQLHSLITWRRRTAAESFVRPTCHFRGTLGRTVFILAVLKHKLLVDDFGELLNIL